MSHPRFDLITFDLDDTLWPCLPAIMAAERRLFEWLRGRLPGMEDVHTIETLRDARRRLMSEHPEIAHDLTRVRRHVLERLFEEYGGNPADVEEGMALFLDQRNRVQLYQDVRPVLSALRRRYTLISVTNGNADVGRIGIADLFHHSLSAAEAGAARPAPALFECALQLADVEPGNALHVGDDPVRDVQAARGLGLTAVWMDRNGQAWPGDLAPPHRRVADLFELQAWLDDRAPVDTV